MKIGIITHFNKSINYGGVLQAYALAKKLNDMGYDAEQIAYVADYRSLNTQTKPSYGKPKKITLERIISSIKYRLKKIIFYTQTKKRKNATKEKQNCFKLWTDINVRSSKFVYNANNISECNNLYDAFITGSDQVWNYNWYDKNYFLDFANNSKIKLSYAASMGYDKLPTKIDIIFENHLKSFNAVSVREQNMVDLLKGVSPVDVEWVLDPVFLLKKEDWERAEENGLKIKGKYIFCYFFGNNEKERKIVREYARKKSLKIVIISGLNIENNIMLDETYADIKLKTVNPGEFLSLIKNAEYVFTDSFHATAFSLIYHKQFFVFNRDSKRSMNSRIKSVTKLFNVGERFCEGENENLGYVNSLKDIDYTNNQNEFNELKHKSIKFLIDNLGGTFNG